MKFTCEFELKDRSLPVPATGQECAENLLAFLHEITHLTVTNMNYSDTDKLQWAGSGELKGSLGFRQFVMGKWRVE